MASCLASCYIACLSIFFACFVVSSKRLSRAFTAAGVTGVPLANNDNSPSKSGGSAFCVVVTSSDSTFCMLLGGRPVQSHKRMVHRPRDPFLLKKMPKWLFFALKWCFLGLGGHLQPPYPILRVLDSKTHVFYQLEAV